MLAALRAPAPELLEIPRLLGEYYARSGDLAAARRAYRAYLDRVKEGPFADKVREALQVLEGLKKK